jgi:hypothetical protein
MPFNPHLFRQRNVLGDSPNPLSNTLYVPQTLPLIDRLLEEHKRRTQEKDIKEKDIKEKDIKEKDIKEKDIKRRTQREDNKEKMN